MNPPIKRTPTLLRPSQRPNGPSRRPASIAELAQRARDDLWDERRELKFYLRSAERHRKTGKEYAQGGDLEAAFVEFARAATLVLEKLPTHKDYLTVLTAEQRHNLGLNGQDILDSLSELKPTLVERYERWVAAHPNAPEADPNYRPQAQPESVPSQKQSDMLRSQDDARQRGQAEASRKQDQERRVAEELEAWKRQREDAKRLEEGDRERAKRLGSGAVTTGDDLGRRGEAATAVQWASASSQQSQREPDYTFSRRPTIRDTNQYNGHRQEDSGGAAQADYSHPEDSQRQREIKRQDEARRQFQQQQQEEMRRREEDITRRRMEERRQEHDGITRRQQEAEAAARETRHSINAASSSSSAAPFQQAPPSSAATVRMPTAMNSRHPPLLFDQYPNNDLIMPLESPSRYEGDSTDSETITDNQSAAWRHARASKQPRTQNADNSRTPTRPHLRSPLYPPPITTTSPPPPDGPIRYPQMSQHQKLQGYVPSLHSMFSPIMKPPGAPLSLLFEPGGSQSQSNFNSHTLYPSSLLPQPSAPIMRSQNYPYGMPYPQQQQQQQQQPQQQAPPPPPPPQQHSQYPGYRGPSRAPPPIPPGRTPPSTPPPSAQPLHHHRSESARITKPSTSRSDPVTCDLKSVSLPRECLPRFLSIAALNTSRNFETCGLLLGKDKGTKFIVTTLLIPKQHSTSDTCTMDEEELVLQFTEERSLITLGWIHTHPSQSCFMSSVDLHTHSGFQRMLPESFAVVCAPKSNPNFGIFRLTDPPGLQTILGCSVKEAFHPHPDVPIYTDADKGHVQMKDMSLEIVDLR